MTAIQAGSLYNFHITIENKVIANFIASSMVVHTQHTDIVILVVLVAQ